MQSRSKPTAADQPPVSISPRQSRFIFACFATAYFFSYGLRSVNAALAPFITQDLALTKAQLGWLSSAFFIALAVMQVPLGIWLDRFGARRVESVLLGVAAVGSFALVWTDGFAMTSVGRILIGCGVSASLMAPFSYFRRCYPGQKQAQLALWILVAGTVGAAFFTTPAAMLAEHFGWRSVHLVSGLGLALIAVLLWCLVPDHDVQAMAAGGGGEPVSAWRLLRDPLIIRVLPLSLVGQGGVIALQTLWSGPWMTDVLGMTPAGSAWVLMFMMVVMVVGYLVMGFVSPPLQRRFGLRNVALVGYAICFSIVLLIALLPVPWAWVLWLLLAVGVAPVALMQAYVSMQFPREAAGRVVTLYNMFVFIGAFCLQWGVGVAVDALMQAGVERVHAYGSTLIGLSVLQAASLLWFMVLRTSRANIRIA